jgi:ferredoxin
MKVKIYYFSGTGNSFVAARDLARELGGEVISIGSVIGEEKIEPDADIIGIVFPVYIWGTPVIVEKFISKLKGIENKYIFSLATYGGSPGAANIMVKKYLKKVNGELAAGFGTTMPGNYTPMYGAISKEKQEAMFGKWKNKVKEIVAYVNSKQKGYIKKSNFLVNALFTGVLYNIVKTKIPGMDKKFWSSDSCNGCGICKKICPVNNIEIIDGKPKWNNSCEQCFACLQWCPKEAIEYGKNTKGRKRYRNPDVKIKDFIKN